MNDRTEDIITPWSVVDEDVRRRFARLPRSLLILLENIIVHEPEPEGFFPLFEEWLREGCCGAELPFRPGYILMQDTAGVAALADMAALRDHAVRHGRQAAEIDARIPVHLVIDHSVKVDHSGTEDAFRQNLAEEYSRNTERYSFFRWAEQAFEKLTIVPPGHGICHQVNLEQLANITALAPQKAGRPEWTCAETLIGTDSHSTMVNALGILGWGVGGIEAELAALGAAVPVPLPRICEVRITGKRQAGVSATDIALSITSRLRGENLVDQIIEFSGEGLDYLSLPDRAAIANMCPEYGATAALFPVDEVTLRYLADMGRSSEQIDRARAYARATGLWRDSGPPRRYSHSLVIALDAMEPVMAGPRLPQQLRPLSAVPASLREAFADGAPLRDRALCSDGAVAIAAITSCTNTANPHLMIAAGMLARNAVARGLSVPLWVKTSLAPGSRRVAWMLKQSGLQSSLDALGFHLVGFGCATCVGNSGELKPALQGKDAPALLVALLSGNRNFENRIHPAVRANYLASPPLVVAGALAGNLHIDLGREALGYDRDGQPVYLSDIWPDDEEIEAIIANLVSVDGPEDDQDEGWTQLTAPDGPCFAWDEASTFIRRPPFFDEASPETGADIMNARPLLWLEDVVTTDHISPIGKIMPDSPAGFYLQSLGEDIRGLGSYGDRRANHHVMHRGTFDNARLYNRLAGRAGNYAIGPDGRLCSVFDAAQAFKAAHISVVIIAGDHYGTGSARDWAAKGTALLGVRAVIARSFERIHRANLIAMGVMPVVVKEELPPIGAGDHISLRGFARLTPQCSDLVVDIHRSDTGLVASVAGRADIWSATQLEMIRQGGLFAALRARYS